MRRHVVRPLTCAALLVLLAAAGPPAGAGEIHPDSRALVDAMIDAHGGMDAWRSAPTVAFTEEYREGEAASGPQGRVVVEQGRTRDPGVNIGPPGTGTLPGDPTEYVTLRMTFDEGVGDTPDDHYVLYLDPETHRLAANEYVVTYQAILPEGLEATPPHVLVYEDHAEVDGLVVPTRYTIYEDGAVYGTGVFTDWSFSTPWDERWMEMPADAVVDETTP